MKSSVNAENRVRRMNHEMMLYQTRQDFVDLFLALFSGERYTIQHIEQLVTDLKGMDAINLEYLLDYVHQTEGANIRPIWEAIEEYIQTLKQCGEWETRKEEKIFWKDGTLYCEGS